MDLAVRGQLHLRCLMPAAIVLGDIVGYVPFPLHDRMDAGKVGHLCKCVVSYLEVWAVVFDQYHCKNKYFINIKFSHDFILGVFFKIMLYVVCCTYVVLITMYSILTVTNSSCNVSVMVQGPPLKSSLVCP